MSDWKVTRLRELRTELYIQMEDTAVLVGNLNLPFGYFFEEYPSILSIILLLLMIGSHLLVVVIDKVRY